LPPSRDAFGRALLALRRRLRDGVDAPGAALPIHLIASELRLSTTPVREALSRLAGEHLVDKRGPVYTRPQLDGPTLAELHDLRRLTLETALTPDKGRKVRRRAFPPRPPLDLGAALAAGHSPVAEILGALFLELVLGAGDLILAQTYQGVVERLAPFQPLEAQVFPDLEAEAHALITAFEASDPATVRLAVRRYHRRRVAAAGAIVGLSMGEKYRTDIV
jgi:DNA-binding GntR family transcriptional regulator